MGATYAAAQKTLFHRPEDLSLDNGCHSYVMDMMVGVESGAAKAGGV